MPVDTTTASLKSPLLFADLEESKLEDFRQIFQLVAFVPGERLMMQGHVADSIFFLESGTVEVVVTLPGGGERVIATLGPGSVIGEMALLDEIGTRTATVRAVAATRGFLIERQYCRALLMQPQQTTFTVQRRITLSLCRRVRELLAMVMNVDSSHTPPTGFSATEPVVPATPVQLPALVPEYRNILPQLPFFQHFLVDEIEQVLTYATVLTVPHKQVLFQQDSASRSSYLILRGAVELVSRMAPYATFAVLGPGCICGHLALIDDVPHDTSAITGSEALLLAFPQQTFQQLFTANTRMALKFQHAILQSLLTLQAKLDNHLARLISQASLRTQRKP